MVAPAISVAYNDLVNFFLTYIFVLSVPKGYTPWDICVGKINKVLSNKLNYHKRCVIYYYFIAGTGATPHNFFYN